jgi:hypothetical protein
MKGICKGGKEMRRKCSCNATATGLGCNYWMDDWNWRRANFVGNSIGG